MLDTKIWIIPCPPESLTIGEKPKRYKQKLNVIKHGNNERWTQITSAIFHNYFRDLPKGVSVRFSKVNSAVLTTSVHPRPDKAILENDPVIIVFKHHREARGNLTENANATQQNETSVPSKKPPPYYRTEKTHCVFWKEGNEWDKRHRNHITFN